MKKQNAKCRRCGWFGKVVLRKTERIKTWIKHKLTGNDVYVFQKRKALSQRFASITGIPCPKCLKHKLARP